MNRKFLYTICIFYALFPTISLGATEPPVTSPTLSTQGMDVYSAPAPLTPAAPHAPGLTPPASTATTLSPLPVSPAPISPETVLTPPRNAVQERVLPPSPAVPTPTAPPRPTAEQIEEAKRQEALRVEQEAQRKRELALAQEQARQEKLYMQAEQLYAKGSFEEAYTLWSSLADEGHAFSMTALGLLHDRGEGVALDSKKAVAWFRKAAEAGNAKGMYHLGRMLVQGRGGAQHLDTAARWLRRAADLGQHDAQYLLAVLYERGRGVVKNLKEAAAWYSHAAMGNNTDAQARLGHMYRTGKGVTPNKEHATLLLYAATMAGHVEAQQELFAMSQEVYGDAFPKVTLFGAEIGSAAGLTRSTMRAALSISKVKAIREDAKFICDVYDLTGSVPGANHMAACYGLPVQNAAGTNQPVQAQQEMGFLKIDYAAGDIETANAVQSMVEARFGKPTVGEQGRGYLWNLGNVIIATQYVPEKKEVGLMYMIPRVYHTTQRGQ